jgi:hypothetical protein
MYPGTAYNDVVATARNFALSPSTLQSGNWMQTNPRHYTNATRPTDGADIGVGMMIWNDDDDAPNWFDSGGNWIDLTGAIT